jgi:hypothetical protein
MVSARSSILTIRDRASVILGLEPHPKLLEMVSQKSHRDRAKLIEGSAESIPLVGASIDTVVTTWTLCSIPDLERALLEMRRSLDLVGSCCSWNTVSRQMKGAEVAASPHTALQGPRGCHLDRPNADLVEGAGFRMKRLQRGYMEGPKPMTLMYEGVASPS